MYILLAIQFFMCLFFGFTKAAETTCVDSQKHFANLCFTPKPFARVDFEWSQKSQPSDGWHTVIGNDVARLHLAEAIKGELLSTTDNYDDLCFRAKILHADNPADGVDGTFYGYGNLTSDWNCKLSMDFPGVLVCDDITTGPSKYHENYNYYTSFTDNKNIQVGITCFPNGQVGWVTFSISKTLTDAEKKTIMDHVTSIGFSADTSVTMYDEKRCSNE